MQSAREDGSLFSVQARKIRREVVTSYVYMNETKVM
jgi:hypothetical protein